MAVMIQPPFIHVEDANGNPYVGAKLYVYSAGTTSLVSLYSDDDLLVSLANPLTSDSAGNFARAFLAAGTYKLRAETSTGTLIWQYDDIDTCLSAGSGALPVNRGGTGSTTAAGARTNLDVPSNADVTALSSQITTFQSIVQSIVSAPQGRLTLTSGTPVISADVSAGTAVYYTPYVGNLVPLWDGTKHVMTSFSELTLAMNSNHTASNIYDVFIFLDSGTPTIGTGPAWNTATAGAGARGSGAGTTELERKGGLWVNKAAITARNGGTTYSVDANKATLVGSIYIDGTNGQVTCHISAGQSRKWAVSNAYHRKPIILMARDSTSSWTYASATVRQSNAASGNKVTPFSCLPEESVKIEFSQTINIFDNANPETGDGNIGVGWNSTTAYASGGKIGQHYFALAASGSYDSRGDAVAFYHAVPFIGIGEANALEATPTASGTITFYGGTNMLLKAEWLG